MKKMMLGLVVGSAIVGGCAEDGAPHNELAEDEVSVDVAFYGLTLMDCQTQATQCYENNSGRLFSFLRRPINCGLQLSTCVAQASADAVLDEAEDVTECGLQGVACFSGASNLQGVIGCQEHAESCVIDTVHDLTGVKLPTTREVIETTVEVAGDVVETATEVTEQVVDTAVEVTGDVVETAVEVTGDVVETATEVTGEVVETATEVVTETVETAGQVVDNTLDKVDGAVDCAQESRQCWRNTRDFIGCQRAYGACLRAL